MRGQRRSLVVLVVAAILSSVFASFAVAQGGGSYVNGGSSCVVSRASDPAPRTMTAPSLSLVSVVSLRWNTIVLAPAQTWGWSFAPALVAKSPRPVAVRRRTVL